MLFSTFLTVNADMWNRIEKGALTVDGLWATRWNKIFDIVNISFDGPTFEASFHRHLHDLAIPIDGALDLLEYLHKKYTVCIASNSSLNQQVNRLGKADMLDKIDKIFVSEQVGAQKPNKEFFDACFSALSDTAPAQSIIIGDSIQADIIGAHKYGIHTCWYNPQNHTASQQQQSYIDYTVQKLSQIKEFL